MGLDECFEPPETLVYTILAAFDGLIAAVAFIQVQRSFVLSFFCLLVPLFDHLRAAHRHGTIIVLEKNGKG